MRTSPAAPSGSSNATESSWNASPSDPTPHAGEHFWLAEQVTGVDADTLTKAARSDLADSALHAPQAGFGDVEFYPDIHDKAVVLVCRLAWNHPLPDGNKRAAWAALVMFIDLNDGAWDPDPPNIDEAEEAMLAIAAGEVDEGWTAAWLRERVRFVDPG